MLPPPQEVSSSISRIWEWSQSPIIRMEVIGGNFFEESVPKGPDAYLLRWILHDWSDTEAAAILGSLRLGRAYSRALPTI
jgi:hypothetical protein